MGQVPERADFLLIGDGRLARHLSHYFHKRNFHKRKLTVERWSRRRGVIDSGTGAPACGLDELLRRADRVLLAIRDDALEDFAARHRDEAAPETLWIHFSGSAVIDGVWSAHPLSTFARSLYDDETYASIPFVIEAEGPPFAELLPGLDNPSAAIPRQQKALYHALCVCAGNFTQILWQQLFSVFEGRLGLPPDLARPYLRQTAHNLDQAAGRDVLTGPLARRDHQTIEQNLTALRGAGLTELARIYESFLELADIPADGTVLEVA